LRRAAAELGLPPQTVLAETPGAKPLLGGAEGEKCGNITLISSFHRASGANVGGGQKSSPLADDKP